MRSTCIHLPDITAGTGVLSRHFYPFDREQKKSLFCRGDYEVDLYKTVIIVNNTDHCIYVATSKRVFVDPYKYSL